MRTILHKISLLMSLVVISILTSCDSDTEKSMVLAGQWQGDFGMYYTYTTNTGRTYEFNSYDTDIVFYPDHEYASYGYGKQVDYYDYGPYEYEYHYFLWEVRYGKIYIEYPSDPNLNTVITQYHLTNNIFSGYFNGSSTMFRMYKMTDFYDWTPYANYYSYSSRSGWQYNYYAKGRGVTSAEANASTELTGDESGTITSHGNRFTESKE